MKVTLDRYEILEAIRKVMVEKTQGVLGQGISDNIELNITGTDGNDVAYLDIEASLDFG